MQLNEGRPMDVGAILDSAFSIYRRHFVALVGAVAVIVVPLALLELVMGQIAFLPSILIGLLPSAVGARVVADVIRGDQPTIAGIWNELTPNVVALIVTGILVVLAVIVGLLLIVIPGIIFGVWFSLTAPVIAIESKRYTAAMGRSRELVRGSWWRVFGILLLVGVLTAVASFVVTAPFGGGSGTLQPTTAGTIAGAVANLVIAPFSALATALLYFDLRLRREGTDLARSIDELGPLPPPVA
jgi:hypothetical protein